MLRKIRVLVIDDSMLFREVLSKSISSDDSIEVVATANDPFDARDKILKYKPDVATCDVEMPKMNGIEFIRRLIPQYPLPIVVVSNISEAIFNALNAGAVDFVTKPDISSVNSVENFINELIYKIKIASTAKVSIADSSFTKIKDNNCYKRKIIGIAASTGGTEAISNLISALPSNSPGIVIVQHIPPVFSRMFAERLDRLTNLHVKEAKSGDIVEAGRVYIAPGDQHMRVKKIGDKIKIEVFHGDKVSGHCPSADVLFNSIATECGKNAVGIILTGMGHDGATGLLAMRNQGARTIGQDEKSSIVYGMPKVAYNIGAVEQQASLDNIPQVLFKVLV